MNSVDELTTNFDIKSELLKYKNLYVESKKEMIKLTDWATQLKQQIDEKDLLIEEKQSELMKISDWATQLRKRVEELEKKHWLKRKI